MTFISNCPQGFFFKAAVKFHILKNSYNKNIWKLFATSRETRGTTQLTNCTKKSDTIYLNLSEVNIKSPVIMPSKARPHWKCNELLIWTQVTGYNSETPMEY